MAGTDQLIKLLWRASLQELKDESLYRNPFVLATGATLDATGGKFGGGCLHSTGVATALATAPHHVSQNIGSSDFYMSGWYKCEGNNYNNSRQIIVGKGISGGQHFMFGLIPSANQFFFYHTTNGLSSGEAQLTVTQSFTVGTWYHLACSRSGGVVRLFVNGTLVGGTLSMTNTYVSGNPPLSVGSYGVSGFPYPLFGSINDAYMVIGDSIHTSNFTPETDYLVWPSGPNVFARRLKHRVVPGATRPYPPPLSKLQRDGRGRYDVDHFGPYKIVGTVKEYNTPTNVPLKRQVFLLRGNDMKLIRSIWSDPVTGAYEFLNLSRRHTYTVVAVDYTNNYRAVIGDRQIAEPM